ncbi:winged helix-turn-helix domain-containing protein [Salininema proteolyticum]|uniref:Winged helix-turn-helix domain-containing protein n=1 Tax=Salininema proteolyticum TaxID=1607685 RepID=A0ABV8U0L8_9ACTN
MGPGFDPLIHAPTRLSLVSFLAPLDWAEFRLVREELGLSDSALSKQLSTLEDAGYLEVKREFVGRRPRTSVRLTDEGIRAFKGHVAALRELIGEEMAE